MQARACHDANGISSKLNGNNALRLVGIFAPYVMPLDKTSELSVWAHGIKWRRHLLIEINASNLAVLRE
jgi:hypothetical protein